MSGFREIGSKGRIVATERHAWRTAAQIHAPRHNQQHAVGRCRQTRHITRDITNPGRAIQEGRCPLAL